VFQLIYLQKERRVLEAQRDEQHELAQQEMLMTQKKQAIDSLFILF
jgi:hypothetical protein